MPCSEARARHRERFCSCRIESRWRRASAYPRRVGWAVALIGLASRLDTLAWAQPAPVALPPTDCAVPDGARDIGDLFSRFECSLEAGDYDNGLKTLEQACSLQDSAECSFNFGLIHNTLYERGAAAEHCSRALGYYREYLTRDPYGEGRDDVLLALGELKQSCEARTMPTSLASSAASSIPPGPTAERAPAKPLPSASRAAPLPLGQPPVTSDDSARRVAVQAPRASSSVLPLLLLGAGASAGICALVSGGVAWRANDDLQERARRSGDPDKLTRGDPEAHHLLDSRELHHKLVWAFGLGSVALIGAGTTLLLVDLEEGASFSFGSGGLPGLTYGTAF